MKYTKCIYGVINVFFIALIILICVPIIWGTVYTTMACDDFCLNPVIKNPIMDTLKAVYESYFNWQGTYFGLSGLIWAYGKENAISSSLFVATLLFFIGIILVINKLLKYYEIRSSLIEKIIIMNFLFFIISNQGLNEVFYWFSGAGVYLFPLTTWIFSFILMIYGLERGKLFILLSSLLGFLSAGGALLVTALECSIMLLFVVVDYYRDKKFKLGYLPFIMTMVGGFVNACAPGNFVRSSENLDGGSVNVLDALTKCIKQLPVTLMDSSKSFYYLVLLIISIIVGITMRKWIQINIFELIFIVLYSIFAVVITMFPVALGRGSLNYLPTRYSFIQNFSYGVYLMLLFIALGNCLWENRIKKVILCMFIAMCIKVFCFNISIIDVKEFNSLNMSIHILNGDYQEQSDEYKRILNEIELSNERNVIVFEKEYNCNHWTNMMPLMFFDDPNFWVNQAVATYYDKNTVILKNK